MSWRQLDMEGPLGHQDHHEELVIFKLLVMESVVA